MCKCSDYSTDDKSNSNKHITIRKDKILEGKLNSEPETSDTGKA